MEGVNYDWYLLWLYCEQVPKQAIIIITYIDFSISKLDETEVWAWATLNNY